MSNFTPNVNIQNPTIRKAVGNVLGVVAILSGATAIVLGFWPELASLPVDIARVLTTVNALVAFFSGIFQIAVTSPNVPTSGDSAVTTIHVGDS
jgi:uncharacterized membrane protein HdeD (DUF308 family)